MDDEKEENITFENLKGLIELEIKNQGFEISNSGVFSGLGYLIVRFEKVHENKKLSGSITIPTNITINSSYAETFAKSKVFEAIRGALGGAND